MEDSGSHYLLIFVCLILSAFFAGSETAFFSLSRIQLKKLEKDNSFSTKTIFRLLKKPRQLLITILLSNTFVNVFASSIAAVIAVDIGERLQLTSKFFSLSVEIVIMTSLLLFFGEIIPKLFAYSKAETIAGLSGIILEIIKTVLFPIVKMLEYISMIFSKKTFVYNPDNSISSEEFRNLLISKNSTHQLEENEKRIIDSIFRFSSTEVREVMVPRVDIIGAEVSYGIEGIKKIIIDSGYSRIPVYKKSIDDIIGVIYAKDILLNPEKKTISSLLRKAFFVTENMKIQYLLNQFQTKKVQIAVVVDEYGGTSGLISIEDILEQLVGEIMDEYDEEPPMLTKIGDSEYLVNGMHSIDELNREFGLDIDEEAYDNVAEFLYDEMNKVPTKNEVYKYKEQVVFTISQVKRQRITNVRMKIYPAKVEEDEI